MMTDMTNGVLCTIDFSEGSTEALKWAIKFSKKLNCHLTILYTYRLSKNISEEVVTWKKKMEAEAKGKFAAFEDEYLKESDVKYQFKTEVGFVSDRIEDHAKKNGISFLVMARNMFTKSNDSEELMDQVTVPFIIIPSN